MNRRIVYGAIVVLLFITLVAVVLISIFGSTAHWYYYVLIISAALLAIVGIFGAIVSSIDGLQSIMDRVLPPEYPITNKKAAKSILMELANVGSMGVPVDTFDSYIITKHGELTRDERMELIDELLGYELIQRDVGRMKITARGKKYSLRRKSK